MVARGKNGFQKEIPIFITKRAVSADAGCHHQIKSHRPVASGKGVMIHTYHRNNAERYAAHREHGTKGDPSGKEPHSRIGLAEEFFKIITERFHGDWPVILAEFLNLPQLLQGAANALKFGSVVFLLFEKRV